MSWYTSGFALQWTLPPPPPPPPVRLGWIGFGWSSYQAPMPVPLLHQPTPYLLPNLAPAPAPAASQNPALVTPAEGDGSTPECGICLEVFHSKDRPPLTLRCHHNLCRDCLHSMATTPAGYINCPFCRKLTKAKRGNRWCISENALAVDLLKLLEAQKIKESNNPSS